MSAQDICVLICEPFSRSVFCTHSETRKKVLLCESERLKAHEPDGEMDRMGANDDIFGAMMKFLLVDGWELTSTDAGSKMLALTFRKWIDS